MNAKAHTLGRWLVAGLAVLIFGGWTMGTSHAQLRVGEWNEIVGKKVYGIDGERIGTVRDIVLDVENGRYVGLLIASGGVLGMGVTEKIVPPGAVSDSTTPRTVILNVSKERFRVAPTFALSEKVGPPYVAQVAEVYRYYGQEPYFSTVMKPSAPLAGPVPEQLGYIQQGSKIRSLTVENLQGKSLGRVTGFRGMDRNTMRVTGVIITPESFDAGYLNKIVPPLALRYNPTNSRLRLNDNDLPFSKSADFAFAGSNKVLEEPAIVASVPPPPVVQGDAERDKETTLAIQNRILADDSLSHYARNVQVGTVNGKTSIMGRVESQRERNVIAGYAASEAGARNVSMALEIRPMTAAEAASNKSRPVANGQGGGPELF